MSGGSIVKGGSGGEISPEMQNRPLSGKVNFGNGALVGGPTDDSHVLRTIIQVKGSDEEAVDMTAFISVQPHERAEFDIADLPYIRAKVVWGSGGTSHEAFIDVGVGTSFSVMASFLRVDVGTDPAVVPGGAGASHAVMVQGFVSYGRHIGQPVTRTLYFEEVLAGATSANQAIPVFARNVRITGSNPAINYQFQVSDLGGVKMVGAGTQISAEAFILPNDAKNIRVINPGVAAAFVRALFELNL